MIHIPSVNLSQQFVPLAPAIFATQVIFNPSDEVIFERALDELVEEVAQEELVYVRLRKSCSERLQCIRMKGMQRDTHLYIQ